MSTRSVWPGENPVPGSRWPVLGSCEPCEWLRSSRAIRGVQSYIYAALEQQGRWMSSSNFSHPMSLLPSRFAGRSAEKEGLREACFPVGRRLRSATHCAGSARKAKSAFPSELGRGPCHSCPASRADRRRGRDSNPRYPCGHFCFRDRPDRPLRHLSFYLRCRMACALAAAEGRQI